jgi:putative endonuclease
MLSKKDLGALGEKLALDYLEKQGYRIIQSNFKCGFGEIDIIAYQRKVICFIEVKTRSTDQFGRPEEAVTRAKQERQKRIVQYYLYKKKIPPEIPCRFDIVSIKLTGDKPEVKLITNAFI